MSAPLLSSLALAPETLAAGLGEIARTTRRDAELLAAQPFTWRVLAQSLCLRKVPWETGLEKVALDWTPRFRAGRARPATVVALETFLQAKPVPASAAGAEFLLCHFSGEALARLRREVQALSRLHAAQAPAGWWQKTPACGGTSESIRACGFTTIAPENETTALAGALLPGLTPWLQHHRADFSRLDSAASSARESEAGVGRYFAVTGRLSLDPTLEDLLFQRLVESAADLLTTPAWEEQADAARIAVHLDKKISTELLHASHVLLGQLQEALLGSLVVAGYPLLYWHNLAEDARPTPALPPGRRQDFTSSEAAAFWKIFSGEARQIVAQLSATAALPGDRSRETFLASTRARLGRRAFSHLSIVRLFWWVEELPKLLDHPQWAEWSWGRSRADLEEDIRCFQQIGERLRSLFHLILARNNGLAGSIHAAFIRKNRTFQNAHEAKDVAALVREEMMKAAASFDFATGVRFSTYAVNRVNLELRRRPHQERQLIKLSSDQTTAQPRIWQLALSSELAESDPNFYRDLSERYNAQHTGTGRAPMTPSQAADLLRVGHIASLAPVDSDDEDRHPALDIPSSPDEISPAVLAEIAECVRAILKNFAPSEEFALSLLLKVSPPRAALHRFNRDLLENAQERLQKVIARNSSPNPEPGSRGGTGRRVRVAAGQMSEKILPQKKSPAPSA